MMERHRSQPYNPNIANGFFRAGYVEIWGRGIEKICEACKKHGVPLPEYKIHLEDIMIKFTPLMSAKVPKRQNGTLNGTLEEKVLLVIKKNPHVTQPQIAQEIGCQAGVFPPVCQRIPFRYGLRSLADKGMLEKSCC